MAEEKRCAVCGKVLDGSVKAVRIELGTFTSKGFQPGKEWGIAHAPCFNKAMPTPKAALAEIRRLAREIPKEAE
jgi:hypothetical protein